MKKKPPGNPVLRGKGLFAAWFLAWKGKAWWSWKQVVSFSSFRRSSVGRSTSKDSGKSSECMSASASLFKRLVGRAYVEMIRNRLCNDLFRCLSRLPTIGTNVEAETTCLNSEFFSVASKYFVHLQASNRASRGSDFWNGFPVNAHTGQISTHSLQSPHCCSGH